MNLKLAHDEARRILEFRHEMHMNPELSHQEFRHEMHMNPELSHQEFRTTENIAAIVLGTAEAYECRAEIEYKEILPPVFNSEEMYKKAVRAAELAVGRENVIDAAPTLASEDFSIIMARVPSFFYWIGSGRPGQRPYAWHQSRFQADDEGVLVAAEIMAAVAKYQ